MSDADIYSSNMRRELWRNEQEIYPHRTGYRWKRGRADLVMSKTWARTSKVPLRTTRPDRRHNGHLT